MPHRSGIVARTSAFAFPQDLLDEGIEQVLDRLKASGVNGVTVATTYHHGRDLVPHNPRRSLLYHEGGVTYFEPPGPFNGPLQPTPSALVIERPIQRLLEAAAMRDMHVSAWTVFLHNSRLGTNTPAATAVNAFGDSIRHALCPANPAVRSYAVDLAAATARLGVSSIAIEALTYLPVSHGDHHERTFVPFGGSLAFLLDLCFCLHCTRACARRGVDIERIRQAILATARLAFESGAADDQDGELHREQVAALCGGEIGGLLNVRQAVVTSLVEEVSSAIVAVDPTTSPVVLDPSGAILGYATGQPTTHSAASGFGWQVGLDPGAVAQVSGRLGILAYAMSPERVAEDVRAYQACVPEATQLTVVLRPMAPDTASVENLRAKLERLTAAEVAEVSFYHYGLMPMRSLDWIREALA